MRSLVVVTVFLTLASAQSLPSCATFCVTVGVSESGCSSTDTTCLCQSAEFSSSFKLCLDGSCTNSDSQSALQYIASECASSGVTTVTSSAAASVLSSAASVLSAASSVAQSSVSSALSSALSSAASSVLISSAISSFVSAASSPTSSAASSLTTADATTFSTQTTISASSRSSTSAAAQTSPALRTPDTSSRGSGSRKYIGIGVGVGVTCILIFGGLLIWFIWRRRRSSKADLQNHPSMHRSGDGGDKMIVTTTATSSSSDSAPHTKHEYKQDIPAQVPQAPDRSQESQELEAMQRRIQELEAQQRAHELQAAKRRVQELEAQQRAYEMEAQQRYEMEHSRDRYAMLPSNENTLPPKYRNSRGPVEFP